MKKIDFNNVLDLTIIIVLVVNLIIDVITCILKINITPKSLLCADLTGLILAINMHIFYTEYKKLKSTSCED